MKSRAAIIAEIRTAITGMKATPALIEAARDGTVTRVELIQFLRDAWSVALEEAFDDFAERAGGVPSVRQISRAGQDVLFGQMADQSLARVQAVAAKGADLSDLKLGEQLRRAVALSDVDATAVKTYVEELEGGKRRARRRALRDRRFDANVGRKLSQAKIDLMSNRYRERLERYRANQIAKMAAAEAEGATAYAHWTDRLDSGDEDARLVRKFWDNREDHQVRDSHVEIPLDYPLGVPLNEAFVTKWGIMRYPHDSQGHPKDRVGCRCRARYEVVRP